MAKNTTDVGEKVARLSLPLTPDGTAIDWEHIRPSTIEKFTALLQTDPNIRDHFDEMDGKKSGGPDLFGGITSENVAAGLDLLSSVQTLVFRIAAAKWVKHPLLRDTNGKPIPLVLDQDVLDRAFKLTAAQHEELDPRATRLAQKYSGKMPSWLKENLDLYMFAAMFLRYTGENAKNALGAQINRDLGRAREAFATAAATRPKNPQPDSDVRPVPAQPVNGHDRTPPAEFVESPDATTNDNGAPTV